MQHSTCRRPLSILLTTISIGLSLAAPAAAQLSRVGATTTPVPIVTRGNDSAYDPINRVYLVIGTHGTLNGAYVNEAGAALTGPFPLSDPNLFAQYPRVIYSPEVNGTGGFLVVWHSADYANGANQVHARTISYGGAVGADTVIGFSQPLGSFWEMAPAGAFSTTSHVFLIAWKTLSTDRVDGVRVSPSGQPIGAVFQISNPGEYSRDPGVAWNPNTDEFGVSMSGADNLGASASFTRVRGSDGAVLGRTIIEHSAGSYITDVTFNSASNTFVMAWWAGVSKTAQLNASGTLLGIGTTASAVGKYDGLSVAYNPVSGTILMVGTYTYEAGGVELNGAGAKIGAEQEVTVAGALPVNAPKGSYYPRVTSNKLTSTWDVTFSLGFAAAASQIIATGGVVQPPTDTDGDGVPDSIDQCPTVFAQTANGCPAAPPPNDTDGDGVPDSQDPCPTIYAASPNGCPVQSPLNGNFSGQGGSHIVFENKSNSVAYYWTMSQGIYTGGGYLWNDPSRYDPAWKIVGTTDLTGDGMSDILWQNQQTGAVRLFRMANSSKIGEQTTGLQTDPSWRIVATGDFNNDGQADIVWQHVTNGNVVLWFMKGINSQAVFQSAAYVTSNGAPVLLAPTWRVVGTSDFNGDGYRDLAFENTATGEMNIWGLGARNQLGVPIVGEKWIGQVNPDWQIKAIADYAGDANDDALFQSTSTGQLFLWTRVGANFVASGYLNSPSAVWEATGPR
ncbi:MAG: FG-GAP-like repeat-containing protein [Ardenticatenales bacterium]